MRIGIIGATGHVGQEMVKAALAKDHEVTAIVRNRAKVEKLFGSKVTVLAKDALTLDRVDLDGWMRWSMRLRHRMRSSTWIWPLD